jgi:DNA polymerase-1
MTAEMAYYGAKDVALLLPLFRDQIRVIKEKKLEVCAQDEFDVIPAVAEMEIEGICLATGTLNQIIQYWLRRLDEVEAEILHVYDTLIKKQGKTSELLFPEMSAIFNLKSNAAKLAALRELDIDLDNIKRDSLKEAAKNTKLSDAQRKLAKLLAEHSNIFKMTSTYGNNMLAKINPTTGMWHPDFFQMGSGEAESRNSGKESNDTTATGRMSSDAQQFPKPQARFDIVTDTEEHDRVMAELGTQINQIKAAALAAAA